MRASMLPGTCEVGEGDMTTSTTTTQVTVEDKLIPLTRIRPDNGRYGLWNDRETFSDNGLKELAASIQGEGLHTPLWVWPSPDDGDYIIIAGGRRWRACHLAGLAVVPCRVYAVTRDKALDLMLLENTARADLLPVEEARAYARRIELGDTAASVARKAGKSASFVSNALKLLDLITEVQELINNGDMPVGYGLAMAAARLDTNRQRIALAALRDNPSPSLAWYKRVCGELAGQQAQLSMDDLPMFGGELETWAASLKTVKAVKDAPPPHPARNRAPTTGVTLLDVLTQQAAYWRSVAAAWQARGCEREAAECLTAAAALDNAAAAARETLATLNVAAPSSPSSKQARLFDMAA